jgi:ribosomal-protein-alanine N-acetyltransferase
MEEKAEVLELPEIETERLVLRALTWDDMDFIFHHFGQDEINEFSSYDNLRSMDEAMDLYTNYLAPSPTAFRLGLVLKETKELIGTIGYYRWSKKDLTAMLGADLAKEHWGKGLMHEALVEAIRFGFEVMELNRIEATANAKNVRSLTLAERLGFKKEGLQRQKYRYKGQFHDEVLLSILKEDWLEDNKK